MNILAIGAHPDDIEFGCGGTLIKYGEKGHNVYLLVLTAGGVGGVPEIRKKEQEKSAAAMKAKGVFWGEFQDTELPSNKILISRIEEVIQKVNPNMVFFNYFNDTHQDHRIASQTSLTATRYIKEVLSYEVPTSQNFEPDIFVDIKDVIDRKMELLKIHSSQVDKTRVENLTILESAQSYANFRGYQARVKYAEGFKALRVLREI